MMRFLPRHPRFRLVAKKSYIGALSVGFRQLSIGSPGVFGVPGLNKPSDWSSLTKKAMVEVDAVRKKIYAKTDKPESSVLDDLDQISYMLCEVIDVAELCRSVHVDEGFRQADGI